MTNVPPVRERVPHERTHHGDTVLDDYAWLADKDDPDTVAYLTAENAYTDARTAHLADAAGDALHRDQDAGPRRPTSRCRPARAGTGTTPARSRASSTAIHCRRAVRAGETAPPATDDGGPLPGEQVLLDGNARGRRLEFFSLGTFDVSPDGHRLAYSVDLAGDERFTLRFKDLRTGATLPDEIAGRALRLGLVARRLDAVLPDRGRGLAALPGVAARPRHARAGRRWCYEEPDERFWVGVDLTRSRGVHPHRRAQQDHQRGARRSRPTTRPPPPRSSRPRRQGVEYAVEHDPAGDRFLILHNDGAEDFALAWTPVAEPGPWHELIPHTPGHAAARRRRVRRAPGGVAAPRRPHRAAGAARPRRTAYDIAFPEPVYRSGSTPTRSTRPTSIRLHYTSLVTPDTVYDYDLTTREMVLRKQKPVLGGYDPADYEQHREWAMAADGTRVPISLVCRRGTPRDGSAPTVLYGYGSYEASMDPWFSIPRLSLAGPWLRLRGGPRPRRRRAGPALVRGRQAAGQEEHLHRLRRLRRAPGQGRLDLAGPAGRPGRLGRRAARWARWPTWPRTRSPASSPQVPFVDPLNTILDPSLPLTVTEWEEWGNPLESAEVYAYMKSYAPYENVAPQPYPAILAMGSLNDTRVLYHEPAKWVARLRAVAPAADVLLKTEMGAGHGGPSGRYDAWKEEAFIVAWILDRVRRRRG